MRDGEQTPHVAYTPAEKLRIARMLLDDVAVDRIEIGSAGASAGEREAVTPISAWARSSARIDRVEVLGFCDGARSPQWIADAGARRMNLLTKGSEAHCRQQLGMAPAEHFSAVEASLRAAASCEVVVAGAYLEDFSRGFAANPAYVLELTRRLLAGGVQRVFLSDTLGLLAPGDVERQVRAMIQAFPEACFEFHGHDDYGLATANVLAAVRAGARGVHTSVNGLGERAGNARLCEVVMALHDHAGVRTSVRESALYEVARWVERCSGKALADNTPIVGCDVFTQTAGIHADGDRKGDLYASRLSPERVGRLRSYALGKLAGRASLDQNLDQLGIALTDHERARLLERVVELGDQKQRVEATDLRRLLDDMHGRGERAAILREYAVTVRDNTRVEVSLELVWAGCRARASASGSSSHAACMAALRDASAQLGLTLPTALALRARVAPSADDEIMFEIAITVAQPRGPVSVVGVASDQVAATMIAAEKLLQLLASHR